MSVHKTCPVTIPARVAIYGIPHTYSSAYPPGRKVMPSAFDVAPGSRDKQPGHDHARPTAGSPRGRPAQNPQICTRCCPASRGRRRQTDRRLSARSPCPWLSLRVTFSDPCTRRQPWTNRRSGQLAASNRHAYRSCSTAAGHHVTPVPMHHMRQMRAPHDRGLAIFNGVRLAMPGRRIG
jgi:hypothetical protein